MRESEVRRGQRGWRRRVKRYVRETEQERDRVRVFEAKEKLEHVKPDSFLLRQLG